MALRHAVFMLSFWKAEEIGLMALGGRFAAALALGLSPGPFILMCRFEMRWIWNAWDFGGEECGG